jgi:hypothetical protein
MPLERRIFTIAANDYVVYFHVEPDSERVEIWLQSLQDAIQGQQARWLSLQIHSSPECGRQDITEKYSDDLGGGAEGLKAVWQRVQQHIRNLSQGKQDGDAFSRQRRFPQNASAADLLRRAVSAVYMWKDRARQFRDAMDAKYPKETETISGRELVRQLMEQREQLGQAIEKWTRQPSSFSDEALKALTKKVEELNVRIRQEQRKLNG